MGLARKKDFIAHGGQVVAQRRRIFEGKNKVIYEGTELGTLVQYFKDDTNIEGLDTNSAITGKGVLNNRISEYLMNSYI